MRKLLLVLALTLMARPAIGQAYMDAGVYDLKKYVVRADCDANGKKCDLYPAFVKVLAACEKLRDSQGLAETGCVINVPEGLHRLSNTVQLCRGHTIKGNGTWWPHGSTKIEVDQTAFWLRGGIYCNDPGVSLGTGGSARIEGIAIQGSTASLVNEYSPGCNLRPQGCGIVGIIAESAPDLERLSLRNLTMGVMLFADNSLGTYVNLWHMKSIFVEGVRHSGFYVQGSDTNAGLGELLSVVEACYDYATWSTRPIGPLQLVIPTCSCYNDRSFLGNTYVGTHSRACIDTVAEPDVAKPHFIMANGLNASTAVGVYAEWDSAIGSLNPDAIAIGGTSTWAHSGTPAQGGRNITGRTDSPFQIQWTRDADASATYLGGNKISIFKINADGSAVDLNRQFGIRYDGTRKSYLIGTNDPNSRAISIAEQTSSSDGTFVGELRIRCSFAPAFTNPPCVP